jgi:hypothetical protein
MDDVLAVDPQNPYLQPDWRWHRAGQIVEGDPVSRRRDDHWILRAYHFRRALDACRTPADVRRVVDAHSPIHWASYLHSHREQRDRRLVPHAIEAMLLTGMVSHDQIGARFGIKATTVEAYSKLFFDVEERLKQTEYILFIVIGEAIYRGLAGRAYDLMWKLFAYSGGIHVLDAVMRLSGPATKPLDPTGARGFFAQDVKSNMYHRAAVAAKTVEFNGFNILPFLEQFNRMVEIEKQGGEHSQDMIVAGVREMVLSLAPRARVGPPAADEPGLVGRFNAGAAELTSDELIDLSLGRELAADAEEAALLRFPNAPAPPAEQRPPD